MIIKTLHGCHGAESATGLVVIIDVFRASTAACYVAAQLPRQYFLVSECATAARLAEDHRDAVLVGKPERGSVLRYDMANSPTRVQERAMQGCTVVHRTTAGAQGVLLATCSDTVLVAGFVNIDATVRLIRRKSPLVVSLIAMGHEGQQPTQEDDLCAACFSARLRGATFDLQPFHDSLRAGPGAYFFSDAQDEYPQQDFGRCLEMDRFSFALQAQHCGTYARIAKVEP